MGKRFMVCGVGKRTFLSLATSILAGCALGPNYERPTIDTPAEFRDSGFTDKSGEAGTAFSDLSWWEIFDDPVLKDLVARALANNYDLNVTVSRVERARALVMQARSPLFPQLGYQWGAARGENSVLTTPVAGNGTQNSYVGALNAFWEIDIWGRIRRQTEAAQAEFLAAEQNRRAVMLSLVSELTQAYLQLLELDIELTIAKDTTASFAKSLQMFQDRFDQGVASALETSWAKGAMEVAAANIPETERQIALKENQICILLGVAPGPIPRGKALLSQRLPQRISTGLPAQLLERRPDLLSAEQTLVAANASVGSALANFFPKVGLSGVFGSVGVDLSSFGDSNTKLWGLGGALSGPLFQGGNLLGQYDQAKAEKEVAILLYQQTYLNALQEVSNTLVGWTKYAASGASLKSAAEAYRRAVSISNDRYQMGKSSYFEVIQAQLDLYPTEISYARAELSRRLVVVQLYQALGGGWKLDSEQWKSGHS